MRGEECLGERGYLGDERDEVGDRWKKSEQWLELFLLSTERDRVTEGE
jgi:hypothetical protein